VSRGDDEAAVRLAHLPRSHPPRSLARREHRRAVDRSPGREEARRHSRRPGMSAQQMTGGPDFRANNLVRRQRFNTAMGVVAWISALIAIAILVIVVWSVARRGWSELNFNLLTKPPIPFSLTNAPQGLSNAFAGTLVIVGLATLMALPVGILIAIYLNEFAPPKINASVSLVLDVLNGIPAIVIGIFVYGLVVVGHGQSGYAGAVALPGLMLPLVA